MQSEDVLAFLSDHPDFLAHHAASLGLEPPGTDRVVVSFAERQLLDLRDRNRQLEARLQQLIRHGENNDQILARMHQLALALLRTGELRPLVAAMQESFARDFGLERATLRLWHPAAEALGDIYNSRNDVRLLARNLAAPYCGPYVNDEVLSWFPAEPVLQSFAQVALRDPVGEPMGLLVFASDDPKRFAFDMQTHYLAQIGELVSAALLRVLHA